MMTQNTLSLSLMKEDQRKGFIQLVFHDQLIWYISLFSTERNIINSLSLENLPSLSFICVFQSSTNLLILTHMSLLILLYRLCLCKLFLKSNYLWYPFYHYFTRTTHENQAFTIILYFIEFQNFQASNAYLYLRGNGLKMSFDFVKEMPRAAKHLGQFDLSPYVGQLPFVWTMELFFPV